MLSNEQTHIELVFGIVNKVLLFAVHFDHLEEEFVFVGVHDDRANSRYEVSCQEFHFWVVLIQLFQSSRSHHRNTLLKSLKNQGMVLEQPIITVTTIALNI